MHWQPLRYGGFSGTKEGVEGSAGSFVIGDERNGNRVREFIILGVAIWLDSRTYGGCEEPLRRWARG